MNWAGVSGTSIAPVILLGDCTLFCGLGVEPGEAENLVGFFQIAFGESFFSISLLILGIALFKKSVSLLIGFLPRRFGME
jgi:hypothetical protein